jgi:hypothetical protein
MPKKETAAAVLDMLSVAGAQTRRPREIHEPTSETTAPTPAVTVTEVLPTPVSTASTSLRTTPAATPEAPRTLRLRSSTAQRLREAWLAAKRDDVLLTAQDFASDLVEEALARRRRLPNSS